MGTHCQYIGTPLDTVAKNEELRQGTLNYREYAAYSFQRNLSTVGYQHIWLPYYDLLIFSSIMTVFKAFK